MDNGRYSIQYGQRKIEYILFFVDRKTLEISVHPDSSVIVKAPIGSDISKIESKIKKRVRWILKQTFYFNQFKPKTPERRYISGETHLYLGKQYRLKINKSKNTCVKLKRGYFEIKLIDINDTAGAKELLEKWYLEKSVEKFGDLFGSRWKYFKQEASKKPVLQIRKMKKRWGSLSKSLTLTLNSDLIKSPKECIDYVIVHELCHLKHQNHSSEFYRLLETVLPDWKKRKHKLELALV
jgi:predicted metal-dependent hydrolase